MYCLTMAMAAILFLISELSEISMREEAQAGFDSHSTVGKDD